MKRSVIALSAIALLVFAGAAFGQAQRGSITVTVTDQDGARLPGATVTAQSDQTLTRRTTVTDGNGVAELVALDPATNYVVTTSLDGFNSVRNEGVVVRAGQDAPLNVQLGLATVEEELIVTAEAPVVDVTSAVTGQDITLQLTESLPTARSYQDYLQIVPGVLPTVGDSGNPASRSGLNYRDIGGEVGVSRDNFYYIEGINVTDNVQGTFGANLNTEIIQEQSVLTGGLPAEFVGAPGLVSNVITKSGGNQFSGSINYYFQDDGLVADNKNEEDQTFSTFDTALTIGGPIVRDKAWFFGSFRRVEREDDVVSPDPPFQLLRTVEREADQGFAKVTWGPTQSDLFSLIFLSDPTDFSGQRDNSLSNARDFAREQGGERFTLNYSRVFSRASLDVGITDHQGDLDDISVIPEPRNDINFRKDDPRTQAEEQLGGAGIMDQEERGNEAARGSLEYLFDTGWGDHTVKGGIELVENQNFRNFDFFGDPPARYNSLALRYLNQNITAGDVANDFAQVDFNPFNASDLNGFVNAVNSSPDKQAFMDLLDADGDGVLTENEVANGLVFDDTTGNPHGRINYDRFVQVSSGAQETESEGTILYLQDTWQWKKWSVNAGVRAEEWEHFSTTGEEIFTFDWEFAPRISLNYDVNGNGRQRISAYYGRYYDPIRNNMTNFAGTVSGRERHEQVWVQGGNGALADGEWVTYRVRGGPSVQDAIFAPTTETPYTDEFQIGYKRDLGRSMSIEANLIKRETRDVLEDYDMSLYTFLPDGTTAYPGPVDHEDSLFLGLDYFGFDTFPDSNFVIATLAGAKRDWEGVELIFRKRFSNRWQMLASYNYADAEGNSNSDSNADFQGDVIWLDPRAPNQFDTQPGLIEHLFKVHASYHFDNGIQLGANYRWNSGAKVSQTFRASGRNLPCITPFEPGGEDVCGLGFDFTSFAGIDSAFIGPGVVGSLENPDYGIFDVRLAYLWDINDRLQADFFVDVFNVFDDQEITQMQSLVSGLAGVGFQEGLEFVDPRRFFLGARLRF